jgi:hypothetical protein
MCSKIPFLLALGGLVVMISAAPAEAVDTRYPSACKVRHLPA